MSSIVDVLVPPLDQAYSYALPATMEPVEVGFRVMVKLGRRPATGYVVSKYLGSEERVREIELKISKTTPKETVQLGLGLKETISEKNERGIKSVQGKYEDYPCFDPSQLDFFQKVADYYGESLVNVIEVAVPPIANQKFEKLFEFINDPAPGKRSSKRRDQILAYLKEAKKPVTNSELLRNFKGAGQILKKLVEAGHISVISQELRPQNSEAPQKPIPIELNAHQTSAVQQISESASKSQFEAFLLHGITGSGKTEVYIESIKHVLKMGRGALVIVPEIALTPQLIDRFEAKLGEQIAVLHSGLHKRTRWNSWRSLIEKKCRVAIGVRSGIFAPVDNLGIIVVDEEHDGSYKQGEGLRYNARDLAVLRAKYLNCPVVLGSATPSFESFHNAQTNRYRYLTLPTKFSQSAGISIELIDMNLIKPWEMPSKNISKPLAKALEETLFRGEQAFVLYNRRGFSSYLQCEECSKVIECPNCSVTFTYHQRRNALMCHYCGLGTTPPQFCTACPPVDHEGKPKDPGKLTHRGAGTERIFEELKELFPGVPIDRLDRDAASSFEDYRAILDKVRRGETKILVGTQMIAKGHDLPEVTLVGVADCDVGLHMPDFRASERVFQLLTQVAGRAGRHEKPGRVLLQTRAPKHLCLKKAVEQDYQGFALTELKSRAVLHYPPFIRLLRVVVSSEDQKLPLDILTHFREIAAEVMSREKLELTILGPAPASLQKLKALWRFHILFKSPKVSNLSRIMTALRSVKIKSDKIRVIFDMDPQDLM